MNPNSWTWSCTWDLLWYCTQLCTALANLCETDKKYICQNWINRSWNQPSCPHKMLAVNLCVNHRYILSPYWHFYKTFRMCTFLILDFAAKPVAADQTAFQDMYANMTTLHIFKETSGHFTTTFLATENILLLSQDILQPCLWQTKQIFEVKPQSFPNL